MVTIEWARKKKAAHLTRLGVSIELALPTLGSRRRSTMTLGCMKEKENASAVLRKRVMRWCEPTERKAIVGAEVLQRMPKHSHVAPTGCGSDWVMPTEHEQQNVDPVDDLGQRADVVLFHIAAPDRGFLRARHSRQDVVRAWRRTMSAARETKASGKTSSSRLRAVGRAAKTRWDGWMSRSASVWSISVADFVMRQFCANTRVNERDVRKVGALAEGVFGATSRAKRRSQVGREDRQSSGREGCSIVKTWTESESKDQDRRYNARPPSVVHYGRRSGIQYLRARHDLHQIARLTLLPAHVRDIPERTNTHHSAQRPSSFQMHTTRAGTLNSPAFLHSPTDAAPAPAPPQRIILTAGLTAGAPEPSGPSRSSWCPAFPAAHYRLHPEALQRRHATRSLSYARAVHLAALVTTLTLRANPPAHGPSFVLALALALRYMRALSALTLPAFDAELLSAAPARARLAHLALPHFVGVPPAAHDVPPALWCSTPSPAAHEATDRERAVQRPANRGAVRHARLLTEGARARSRVRRGRAYVRVVIRRAGEYERRAGGTVLDLSLEGTADETSLPSGALNAEEGQSRLALWTRPPLGSGLLFRLGAQWELERGEWFPRKAHIHYVTPTV
ncbi:hypothetical protein EDB83DRAFT_2322430 [Lactarius deliciosus]|nr:hypothetical protein EDB83DRAFT_2322430 [Lactarius deliciosus]